MRQALLVGLAAVVAAGCSSGDAPELDPLSKREQSALPAVDAAGLKTLLDGHKGKLVVLAVWSAGTKECEGLFAGLAKLAGSAPGTVVVTLNIDRVDDVRDKVLPVVEEQGGQCENRVFGGDPMDVEPLLSPDWGWRVPALAVYDRKGKKAGEFYGRGALGQAEAALRKLLKKRR